MAGSPGDGVPEPSGVCSPEVTLTSTTEGDFIALDGTEGVCGRDGGVRKDVPCDVPRELGRDVGIGGTDGFLKAAVGDGACGRLDNGAIGGCVILEAGVGAFIRAVPVIAEGVIGRLLGNVGIGGSCRPAEGGVGV